MKKIILIFAMFLAPCVLVSLCPDTASAADEKFLSCGPGYILTTRAKLDGVDAYECQKLWCRDLETGRAMGTGNNTTSGYKTTAAPIELCDAKGNCVECFGDRRWCAGESNGIWNPEYGAYTRAGGDNSTYQSYQKGNCFAWRLEKPSCPSGESAVLRNGEWVCVTSVGTSVGGRAASVRRTGTLRRVK